MLESSTASADAFSNFAKECMNKSSSEPIFSDISKYSAKAGDLQAMIGLSDNSHV